MMKNGFAVHLLTALSLTLMLSSAMATPEPPTEKPGAEAVLPEETEPQLEPESKPVVPDAGSRGQLLYENHCLECHASVIHVRETHRALTLKDLEYWVTLWADDLKLPWGEDEIGDVVDYLNHRYYKFEEPPQHPQ
jgi:mono/diheme cytochrome c family protein